MEAHQAIEVMRRAVRSKVFPLYEIRNGREYTITHWPDDLPLEDYFSLQGRFKTLLGNKDMLELVRGNVQERWEILLGRHERSHQAPLEVS
jgi:pyruvate ferredoxin oxidoreductase beta subunit